jgi:hypothetical protein
MRLTQHVSMYCSTEVANAEWGDDRHKGTADTTDWLYATTDASRHVGSEIRVVDGGRDQPVVGTLVNRSRERVARIDSCVIPFRMPSEHVPISQAWT